MSDSYFDFDYRPDYFGPDDRRGRLPIGSTGPERGPTVEVHEGDSGPSPEPDVGGVFGFIVFLMDWEPTLPSGRRRNGTDWLLASVAADEAILEDNDQVALASLELCSQFRETVTVWARNRDGLIHYRVTISDGMTAFNYAPRRSRAPLTFGELIGLLDSIQDPEEGPGSWINAVRDNNLEGASDPERLVDFVMVSSTLYPQLGEFYKRRAREWLRQYEEDDECSEEDGDRP